jgi:hypothetical protein
MSVQTPHSLRHEERPRAIICWDVRCCNDDSGSPTAAETDTPEPGDGDEPTEPPAVDTEEPGDLPTEFGRGPEEAFVLAREACDAWEDWEPDGSESDLEPIVAKAAEARAASTEVRDPVLEGLDRELSGLLNGLQTGEGSGVIALANRLIGEVCEQVG